jgi:hypothetical protein
MEMRMILLASYGFYAKTIIARIKKSDGVEFSPSTVYRVLKQAGVRLRDYRRGIGDEAEAVFKGVSRDLRGSEKRHETIVGKLRAEFQSRSAKQDAKMKKAG